MVTKLQPLENPVLDPRNDQDLLRRALARVLSASRGKLNSFSAGDPVRAIMEGEVFAIAELLYYLNRLPEGFAIQFLQIMGIQRKLGTQARADLTFVLEVPLSSPFYIPSGFVCQTANRLTFRTDRQLIISPGQISGVVSATCDSLGTAGNVSAYAVKSFQVPLTYLKSVTNIKPAAGGVDGESLSEVKSRAFAAIRRRGLVTKDDYEMAARAVLGDGATANAFGNLGANKIDFVKGACHVFCLNPDGSPLNTAQISNLQSSLSAKSHIGTDVFVSSIDIVKLDIRVIARLSPGSNPQLIASTIFNRLNSYLSPGRLPLGETVLVKELEFQARLAGVDNIRTVLVGDHLSVLQSTDKPLPYKYSAAKLEGLYVELISDRQSFAYSYGEGDPD